MIHPPMGDAGESLPLAMVLGATRAQFEACLAMLDQCLAACPDERWDLQPPDAVAKYPFWMVAYHVLCFLDLYATPAGQTYAPRSTPEGGFPPLHPRGMEEFSEEYPSRRFERDELRRYVSICLAKIRATIAAETATSLALQSDFEWLKINRLELHLYNLRHLQHHTGQLTAYLRRLGIETRWVKSGFPVAQGA